MASVSAFAAMQSTRMHAPSVLYSNGPSPGPASHDHFGGPIDFDSPICTSTFPAHFSRADPRPNMARCHATPAAAFFSLLRGQLYWTLQVPAEVVDWEQEQELHAACRMPPSSCFLLKRA